VLIQRSDDSEQSALLRVERFHQRLSIPNSIKELIQDAPHLRHKTVDASALVFNVESSVRTLIGIKTPAERSIPVYAPVPPQQLQRLTPQATHNSTTGAKAPTPFGFKILYITTIISTGAVLYRTAQIAKLLWAKYNQPRPQWAAVDPSRPVPSPSLSTWFSIADRHSNLEPYRPTSLAVLWCIQVCCVINKPLARAWLLFEKKKKVFRPFSHVLD